MMLSPLPVDVPGAVVEPLFAERMFIVTPRRSFGGIAQILGRTNALQNRLSLDQLVNPRLGLPRPTEFPLDSGRRCCHCVHLQDKQQQDMERRIEHFMYKPGRTCVATAPGKLAGIYMLRALYSA